MTRDQELDEATDFACTEAGRDPNGWNYRFMDALRRKGFKLRPVTPEERRRRPGGCVDAPHPHPGDPYFRWPVPSIIIRNDVR